LRRNGRGQVDSGSEVQGLLQLIAATLKRPRPFAALTISLSAIHPEISRTLVGSGKDRRYMGFTPTEVPPLELALKMAAHCQAWAKKLVTYHDTLDEHAVFFDEHAAQLLDQCNTPAEAERMLMTISHHLGEGCTVLDFALRHGLQTFASNRWVQEYVDRVWVSPGLHLDLAPHDKMTKLVYRLIDNQSGIKAPILLYVASGTFFGLAIGAVLGLALRYGRLPSPLGVDVSAAPTSDHRYADGFLGVGLWLWLGLGVGLVLSLVFSVAIRAGHSWATAVLPPCFVVLSCISAVMCFLFSSLALLYAVPSRMVCSDASAANSPALFFHETSRWFWHKGIIRIWFFPAVQFTVNSYLHFFLLLGLTLFAVEVGDQSSKDPFSRAEIYIYAHGAGIVLAELTHCFHLCQAAPNQFRGVAALRTGFRSHLRTRWNVLDLLMAVLTLGIFIARFFVTAPRSPTAGSHQARVALVSTLCVMAWLRALAVLRISVSIGPLVQTVFAMGNDLWVFLVFLLWFICGFGVALVPLCSRGLTSLSGLTHHTQPGDVQVDVSPSFDDVSSKLQWGLWQTTFGVLDMSDFEVVGPLDWSGRADLPYKWDAMVFFFIYAFVAQVLLINLLIAMFSDTYSRIQVNVLQEWRLMKAQIVMEHSSAVNGVWEMAPLNVVYLLLALFVSWPICLLNSALRRYCSCVGPSTAASHWRLPWETPKRKRYVDRTTGGRVSNSSMGALQSAGDDGTFVRPEWDGTWEDDTAGDSNYFYQMAGANNQRRRSLFLTYDADAPEHERVVAGQNPGDAPKLPRLAGSSKHDVGGIQTLAEFTSRNLHTRWIDDGRRERRWSQDGRGSRHRQVSRQRVESGSGSGGGGGSSSSEGEGDPPAYEGGVGPFQMSDVSDALAEMEGKVDSVERQVGRLGDSLNSQLTEIRNMLAQRKSD
jgi:uncharacterized membrane protein YgcG